MYEGGRQCPRGFHLHKLRSSSLCEAFGPRTYVHVSVNILSEGGKRTSSYIVATTYLAPAQCRLHE